MTPPLDAAPSRRNVLEASAAAGSALALGPLATSGAAAQGVAGEAVTETSPRVRLTINGRAVEANVEARVTLLDYLRERLSLTGTKKGCNEGACGACTVLVDGRRENACLALLAQLDGAVVTTVEGLGSVPEFAALQRAFLEHDAFQCGFCTPGQVVSAVACLREGHATDEASVREWMSGNLCRCSAYPQITAAVLDAAGRREG